MNVKMPMIIHYNLIGTISLCKRFFLLKPLCLVEPALPGIVVVSSGSRANASCSLVIRVVCSGPATTVAGVGGIVDVSTTP